MTKLKKYKNPKAKAWAVAAANLRRNIVERSEADDEVIKHIIGTIVPAMLRKADIIERNTKQKTMMGEFPGYAPGKPLEPFAICNKLKPGVMIWIRWAKDNNLEHLRFNGAYKFLGVDGESFVAEAASESRSGVGVMRWPLNGETSRGTSYYFKAVKAAEDV